MLHLLLPEQKKILKSEYTLRFVTVFLMLLAGALVLWIATLVPSFALVQIEKKAADQQQEATAQAGLLENGESFEDFVKDLNQKIILLEKPEFVVSDLIREVVSRQIRSVKINTIEFTVADESSANITLVGIANNRESLVEFSNSLETSEYFQSVDVPFSSFTRSVDIPFSLTINIKRDE